MSNQQPHHQKDISSKEEAQTLCANLLNTTNELISLLDDETSLLRKAKTNEIEPINLRKDALTTTLSHYMERFRNNTEVIRELAPDELSNLQNQRNQFQKSIEANHNALIAMQAVSERILQTVSEKVTKKQSGPEVYTANGNVTNNGVKRSAAITIDTAL